MSWSVNVIGRPEAVVKKLDEMETTMSGQSLAEYQEAKPHLQGLVSQIVTTREGWGALVQVEANGHASFQDGKKTSGNVQVKIGPFYGLLV